MKKTKKIFLIMASTVVFAWIIYKNIYPPIYEFESASEYITKPPFHYLGVDPDRYPTDEYSVEELEEIYNSREHIVIRKFFLIQNPPNEREKLIETAKGYLDDTEFAKKVLSEELCKWDDDTEIVIDITFYKKGWRLPGLHAFGIAWDDGEITSEPYSRYIILSYILTFDNGICTEKYFKDGEFYDELYYEYVNNKIL